MKYLFPQTAGGKWSAGLLLSSFVIFGIFQLLVVVGGQRGNLPGGEINPVLGALGVVMALGAISGFLFGLASILWHKERAAAVWLAVVIGFMVAVFLFGELLVPH